MPTQTLKRFIWPGAAVIAILVIGTIGYWFLSDKQYSLLDTFYMTVITISTIGFGEIIDLSNNPLGRAFTMFIAIAGVGTLFYIITNFTALIVEGELTQSFRRRKMEKKARQFKRHYIICGMGGLGFHIANELHATKRPFVSVDINPCNIENILGSSGDGIFIEGDATDNNTLLKAGIEQAQGAFVVTGDDNQNVVVTLSAKQLNPRIRIVARCNEIKNIEKMKRAGADAVVSPSLIGGLRMASEMIRPTVVSFLDIMLRDKQKNLRIEEVAVPDSLSGRSTSALKLKSYRHILLLAVRTKDDWIYNPPDDYTIRPGDTLIFMATPKGRHELEEILHAGK